MAEQHSIAPPQELIDQWLADAPNPLDRLRHVAIQAARWGADLELKACAEWVYQAFTCGRQWANDLRAARRPKPPSPKQQALIALDDASNRLDAAHENLIRRALEALPDD